MWRRRGTGTAIQGGELGFDALPLIDVLSSSLGAAMMLFLVVVVAPQGGEIIREALGASRTSSANAAATDALSPLDAAGVRTSLMMMVEVKASGLSGKWKSLKRRSKSIIEKDFVDGDTQQWRIAISDASIAINGTGFRLSVPFGAPDPAPFTARIIYGADNWFLSGNLGAGDQFLFDFLPNSVKPVRCRPRDCAVTLESNNG